MLEKVSFIINEIDFPCYKAKYFADYNMSMPIWDYFVIYYSYLTDISNLTWNYYLEMYNIKTYRSFTLYFLKNSRGHHYIKGFSKCSNFESVLHYNNIIINFFGTDICELSEDDSNIIPIKFSYNDLNIIT